MGYQTWQGSLHRQMKEWGPTCYSACQVPPCIVDSAQAIDHPCKEMVLLHVG